MLTVRQICACLDAAFPFSSAEDWDNVGLLLGDPGRDVRRAVVCLDLTREAAGFAAARDADLVLTHHPVIFRPLRSVTPREPWFPLLARGTAVLSLHTNLDAAPEGVSDALREALGLEPEIPDPGEGSVSRFLAFGRCTETDADCFALRTAELFRGQGFDCVPRVTGFGRFSRAAVCGGAGGEFWQDALRAGAGLLVTGEAKYHELVDACNAGLPVMLLGHWLSEQFILPRLEQRLRELDPGLRVDVFREDCGRFF